LIYFTVNTLYTSSGCRVKRFNIILPKQHRYETDKTVGTRTGEGTGGNLGGKYFCARRYLTIDTKCAKNPGWLWSVLTFLIFRRESLFISLHTCLLLLSIVVEVVCYTTADSYRTYVTPNLWNCPFRELGCVYAQFVNWANCLPIS